MHDEKAVKPVWSHSAEEALTMFEVTTSGLTEEEAEARQKKTGANTLPRGKRFTPLGIFLRQFQSPLVFILIGASLLTLALQEWLDTAVILLAVIINVALGFYQEFRAESTLEKLTTYIKERTRVIREGVEEEIDSVLLVPGDVVRLSYGARVPADARLIEANDLSIDEALLTGESLPVDKDIAVLSEGTELPERTNMAFAGTLVVEGTGTAVISATGEHTEIGRIAKLVSETKGDWTPLQRALARLGWFIFAGVLLLVTLIFVLGVIRGEPLFEMLLLAVAISVGSIPEALPIALTVILAVGVDRLARRKGVMRNLAAAETLGSASVILTDKTGTLTEANMQLVATRSLHDLLNEPKHIEATPIAHMSAEDKKLLEAALWGADAVIQNPHEKPDAWRFTGKPIEAAIARAAHAHGIDILEYAHTRTALLTFNSTNKFSISGNLAKDEYIVIGAPDVLLARARLTKDDYLAAEKHIRAIGAEGKRLLGVARLPASAHLKKGAADAEAAKNLDFLGILVFQDPIRPEARAALERIERLGAHVVMLTGDLKETAVSVASELGWEVNEGQVLSGDELRGLPDEELLKNLPDIRIFARVTPEDKLRIGKLYQKLGEVVAMTGDGVNDTPSLKAMNIGIALGSGTDVAKATADLVLLDDNFKTIVAAIEEGRRILENIRKVFVYLMSTALDEVILIGGSLLLGLPLPLTALQIIWVNFFTDSLPALSYAFDENVESRRSGKRVSGSIFTLDVTILTVGIGTLTSLLLFTLYATLLAKGIAVEHARSLLFICFSLYVLVVAFSLRSLHAPLFSYNIFGNRYLNWSVLAGTVLILATVFIPPVRHLFELSLPPISLWWIVIVWLVFNIIIVECAKWGFRTFARHA